MINGEFLMQKRSMNKKVHPGKWSVTGGAVDFGEKPIDAVYRECKEELGIDIDPNKLEYMMSIKRSNVFIDIYLDKENWNINDFKLQKEEVDFVKWIDRKEVKSVIESNKSPLSIVQYFDLLCNLIDDKEV